MEPLVLIGIAALVVSIIIHEVAHGYMAAWLGDPTARLAGRLTLNPIPHIDPLGSLIIPGMLALTGSGILFGWAKPVPYNPYNLSNRRWGEALVAAAGPGVNLLIAFIFAILFRYADAMGYSDAFLSVAFQIIYINVLLAFFNLIPLPPLDGSKILASILPVSAEMSFRRFVESFQQWGFVASFAFIFLFMWVLWEPFHSVILMFIDLLIGSTLS